MTLGDNSIERIVMAAGMYSASMSDDSDICISRAVTIEAEVPGTVVFNAMGLRRAFEIQPGGTANLIGLNITGGNSQNMCAHISNFHVPSILRPIEKSEQRSS